jgi:hypothetical protein
LGNKIDVPTNLPSERAKRREPRPMSAASALRLSAQGQGQRRPADLGGRSSSSGYHLIHSLKRPHLNNAKAAGAGRFLHLMQGLTPEASWRRVFTATIYHTASTSPRLPIEKPANSSSVERSSSIPLLLLTSLRRLQARRSRHGALCCTRLVPPLLSPRLLPRGTLTSAESLPASTRVGLCRGVA